MFKESSKSRGVFRTQTAYYFRNKSFTIDVQLGYITASENIEILKWSQGGVNYRDCCNTQRFLLWLMSSTSANSLRSKINNWICVPPERICLFSFWLFNSNSGRYLQSILPILKVQMLWLIWKLSYNMLFWFLPLTLD